MAEVKIPIRDVMPFKYTVRIEESEGVKRMIVSGPSGQAGVKNENGRVYPRHVWERVIQANAERISKRRVFGELDHPGDGRTSLNRVSHLVTKKWLEGDVVMGEYEILDTTAGKNLQAIFAAGAEVGVSSRGTGSTKEVNGYQEVQDDYVWETDDFVIHPSVTIAYPKLKEWLEGGMENSMSALEQLKSIKTVVEAIKVDSNLDLSSTDNELLTYEVKLNKLAKEDESLKDEIERVKKTIAELREQIREKRKEEQITKEELMKKLAASSAIIEELVARYKRDIGSKVSEDDMEKDDVVDPLPDGSCPAGYEMGDDGKCHIKESKAEEQIEFDAYDKYRRRISVGDRVRWKGIHPWVVDDIDDEGILTLKPSAPGYQGSSYERVHSREVVKESVDSIDEVNLRPRTIKTAVIPTLGSRRKIKRASIVKKSPPATFKQTQTRSESLDDAKILPAEKILQNYGWEEDGKAESGFRVFRHKDLPGHEILVDREKGHWRHRHEGELGVGGFRSLGLQSHLDRLHRVKRESVDDPLLYEITGDYSWTDITAMAHGWRSSSPKDSMTKIYTHKDHPGHELHVDKTGKWKHVKGGRLIRSGSNDSELGSHLVRHHLPDIVMKAFPSSAIKSPWDESVRRDKRSDHRLLSDLKAINAKLQKDLADAKAEIAKLKARQKVDELKTHINYRLEGRADADRLRPLLEKAKSKEEVDNIIKSWDSRAQLAEDLPLYTPDMAQYSLSEHRPTNEGVDLTQKLLKRLGVK